MNHIPATLPTRIGCYVDCSSHSADDCNLETIGFAETYGFKHDDIPPEDNDNYSEVLSELGDEALSYLNDINELPYSCWDFDDNSLFLVACVDDARENVEFVSSRKQDYPPDDYRGEWLHVSDHGNPTLYIRENGKDTEIWSCV